jgi:hypothetical protein
VELLPALFIGGNAAFRVDSSLPPAPAAAETFPAT